MLTLDRLHMPTVLVDLAPIQPLVPHRVDAFTSTVDLMSADLQAFEDYLANEARTAPEALCSSLAVSAKALAKEAALADDPIIRTRSRVALQYFTHLVGPNGGAARAQLRNQPTLY